MLCILHVESFEVRVPNQAWYPITIFRKDDDYYEPQMSTDTFILYATIAILSTLTILFCLCHPEIPVLICMKMTECCCGPFKSRRRGGSNSSSATPSGEYVGGIQMEKRQDGNSEREVI